MRALRSLLVFPAFALALLASGCAHRTYYVASPPPPPPGAYAAAPPLIQTAEREGFRFGHDDGARDAYDRRSFRAEHTRAFHDAPGYDPYLGPRAPYKDAFRRAYVHGYEAGYGGN